MSRRTVAGLLALGLLIVIGGVALTRPVDYVTFRPGPTFNVLGKYDGKTIVNVSGHQTYRDDGALRMVTVYAGGPGEHTNLFDLLYGWVDPDIAVLPKSIYEKGETDETNRQQSAVEMSSSQDNATAAALSVLGIGYQTEVEINSVAEDGAADGKLEKGDVVLSVDGQSTPEPNRLVASGTIRDPGA